MSNGTEFYISEDGVINVRGEEFYWTARIADYPTPAGIGGGNIIDLRIRSQMHLYDDARYFKSKWAYSPAEGYTALHDAIEALRNMYDTKEDIYVERVC